jgi:putative peptidoglycan lipid II flippase
MGPAIFGVSVAQINLMINTLIASFLVTGSVSWLYYSDRLVEFPLGVFGIALATVILPSLSEKHANGSIESFSQTLDWGLRWIVLIGAPASLGLVILAGPMLCTLFQYGEFSGYDVEMASRSLMAYAFGLLGFALIKVLASGYYSRHDTRTPVRVGVVAMAANLVLNLLLVFPLAHAGLALATALSAYLNAGLLYRGLCKDNAYRPLAGWGRFLVRVALANALMAMVLISGMGRLEDWLLWGAIERAWRLTVWVVGGGMIYIACLWLSGLRWEHVTVAKSTI